MFHMHASILKAGAVYRSFNFLKGTEAQLKLKNTCCGNMSHKPSANILQVFYICLLLSLCSIFFANYAFLKLCIQLYCW